jgi:hypothetical protein
VQLPIENKYIAIAAAVGFLLMLWLTDGSMIAAFGVLADSRDRLGSSPPSTMTAPPRPQSARS